jgi:hypothetical protein
MRPGCNRNRAGIGARQAFSYAVGEWTEVEGDQSTWKKRWVWSK